MCKFTAEVDGRIIEGVVKETKEAKDDYRKAMKTGRSAFLVEETLPDVFKVAYITIMRKQTIII